MTRAHGVAFIEPTAEDPRWAILILLGCYVVYALLSPGFSRSPWQFAASASVCLLGDGIINYTFKGLLLVPLSGLVTSMGVLLLCDSPYVWPYAFVAAASILSKHLIKFEGRHVFNPNNLGIVLAMLFFSGSVTVVAGRWGGSLPGMLAIAGLGVLVVRKAGRLDIAAAYVLSFLASAVLRHLATGAPLTTLCAPCTGAAFQLFTFYMITDPMTTPAGSRDRCLFGATLGLLDNAMRHLHVHNAPFFALFILNGLTPTARIFPPPEGSGPWRTRLSQLKWLAP